MRTARSAKANAMAHQIANEIRVAIRSLLACSRPFCAAPHIDWDTENTSPDDIDDETDVRVAALRTAQQRTVNRIYVAAYLVFLSYAYIEHIHMLDPRIALSEKFIYFTFYLTAYLQTVFIAWGALHQEPEYPYFVRTLADIDVRLLQTHTKLRSSILRRSTDGDLPTTTEAPNHTVHLAPMLRRMHIGIGVFVAGMAGASYVDYAVYNRGQFWPWTRSAAIFVLSAIADVLVLLQLCTALWLLQTRYAHVNGLMRRTLAVAVASARERHVRLQGLRAMRTAHMRLNAMHVRLTESFGLLIVCLVLKSVVVLTILLFAAYKYAARMSNWWLFAYSMGWAAVNLAKVVMFLLFGERVETQVRDGRGALSIDFDWYLLLYTTTRNKTTRSS